MTTRLAILALSAVTFAVAPQALKAAQDGPLCPLGNETLHGNYMTHSMGTIIGVGPTALIGWVIYDGKGNVIKSHTESINGVIDTASVVGTYTVNSDCTASEVITTNGNHFNLVVAPDGSRFDWISTVSGRVVSGTAIRFPRRLGDD